MKMKSTIKSLNEKDLNVIEYPSKGGDSFAGMLQGLRKVIRENIGGVSVVSVDYDPRPCDGHDGPRGFRVTFYATWAYYDCVSMEYTAEQSRYIDISKDLTSQIEDLKEEYREFRARVKEQQGGKELRPW